MASLPSLFLPHGAPPFALAPGAAGALLAELGRRLPAPAAIMVVSPHWQSALPTLSLAATPSTIHDFSGFAPALSELRYPAPGAPQWADKVAARLEAAGIAVGRDATRGLDHGAWIPLRHLRPAADIPVFQCSLCFAAPPSRHYEIGRALAPLRGEGLLIVGTGNLTHNFADFDLAAAEAPVRPQVAEFRTWMTDQLQAHRLAELLAYRSLAPHAARAHPTDEHLMPLYLALGAASPTYRLEHLDGGVLYAGLAMDGYVFAD